MARSYDMTKGSIWKNILCFSIPIMVSNLIQSTYNAVDMLFVGRFTGTESLAAVSVCGPIMNVMIITLSGMSAGVLVVISSLLGAGENRQARDAAHTSLALYAIMAAVLTLVGLAFTPQLLLAVQTPLSAMPEAKRYLYTVFAGMSFSFGYNLIGALQQAQGNYDKTVDRNQYGYFKNFSRTHTRNGCTYTQDFGTEDFYVYMMAHAAKHFYQTGCGIRHLIDIYVYLERFGEQMDRNYLDKELEQCGILTFTGHMEKLAYLWLEEEESNALYDNLFAYLLDSGIYGKDENGIWNKFAEEKKKGKTAGRQQLKFWYAFPPLHYMAEYYPYLEDCPWLLPWAWLVRGITGLAKHKGTYKRQMMNHIDEERIRTVQDIYEKMDLKFQS